MAKKRTSRSKSKPPVAQLVVAEPIVAAPLVAEPVAAESVVAVPVVAEPVVAAPAHSEPPPAAPTHEQIARRAYELWLHRLHQGTPAGNPLEDWLLAERDLRSVAA